MKKTKLGIVFGGMSTEHDVSIVSGISIIEHVNKKKYEVFPIYIDKDGIWYSCKEVKVNNIKENIKKIDNIVAYLKNLDVVFPILHGKYGEDGTIQGLAELFNIPIVGSGVLASAIAMDKAYSKMIFKKAGIKQAKYIFLKKQNKDYIYFDEKLNCKNIQSNDICQLVKEKLNYPVFVKPSKCGSSLGINKSHNKEELIKHIKYASKFDDKVLIEECIEGKEIECAILGNNNVLASTIGEIKPAEEFYSYKAKYQNKKSKTIIPANVNSKLSERVKKIAIKAYKAIGAKGFARVDFFVNETKSEVYINEINTIPGFTPISMYSKLWEYDGIEYSKLLDKLIELAVN